VAFSDVRPVLTIGHSNHTLDKFITLLKNAGTELLIDVRARPWNPFIPTFSKETMKMDLYSRGIVYFFMGHCLGLRPSDPFLYKADGTVDYQAYERSEIFKTGIQWLIDRSREGQVCLMAGMANPYECHRHWLIGQNLLAHGVPVMHLLEDGKKEIATADLFHYKDSFINCDKINDKNKKIN